MSQGNFSRAMNIFSSLLFDSACRFLPEKIEDLKRFMFHLTDSDDFEECADCPEIFNLASGRPPDELSSRRPPLIFPDSTCGEDGPPCFSQAFARANPAILPPASSRSTQIDFPTLAVQKERRSVMQAALAIAQQAARKRS